MSYSVVSRIIPVQVGVGSVGIMNPNATNVRLGCLWTPPRPSTYVLVLWDDGGSVVEFTTLGAHVPEGDIDAAAVAAEELLHGQGYGIVGSPAVPAGWGGAWDIVGGAIDVEEVP